MSPAEFERLECRCQNEGLKILQFELPPKVLGLYSFQNIQRGIIILSNALWTKPDWLARTVVYHEVGHHRTFAPGLTLEMLDARANRWAASSLINAVDFHLAALETGGHIPHMAELLGVSPRLVRAYRPQ